MEEEKITNPEELDAALAKYAKTRYEQLWKEAEGRAFRLTDVIALVVSSLLFLNGLVGNFDDPMDGTVQVVFALLMVGFIMLMRSQAQVKALGQLVRHLELKAQID